MQTAACQTALLVIKLEKKSVTISKKGKTLHWLLNSDFVDSICAPIMKCNHKNTNSVLTSLKAIEHTIKFVIISSTRN